MAMSSSPKSSAATICAHADRAAGFKACCMKSGAYDGANHNYYFQGVGRALTHWFRGASENERTRNPFCPHIREIVIATLVQHCHSHPRLCLPTKKSKVQTSTFEYQVLNEKFSKWSYEKADPTGAGGKVFMHHFVAIACFLVCYVVGFQIALSGPGNHDLFGWAILFGIAYAIPSLLFLGLSYVVFILISWWTTVLLSAAAIGIYIYASSLRLNSESWKMALAVVIATIVHQLIMLGARQDKRRPT
jgi:hypothetical protein